MADTSEPAGLDANTLRALIRTSISEHPAVLDVSLSRSVFTDRLGLNVLDRAGLVWRVHVLTEPRTS